MDDANHRRTGTRAPQSQSIEQHSPSSASVERTVAGRGERPSARQLLDTDSDHHPISVLGRALSDSRWEAVEEGCASCGAQLCRLTAPNEVRLLSSYQPFSAAIVELDETAESSTTCLSIISDLKDVALPVIAYADGLSSWPIGSKCRVLLAGAKYLLDSQKHHFRSQLAATLHDLLLALRQQKNEENATKNLAESCGIVGESESLMESFRQLIRFSKLSDLPVLITGESGTGKELFASALHVLDPKRCQGPFVTVNCAAINAAMAESELFGHVRGAFTGATQTHSGYFRAAQSGVLFLDEIGELSPDIQAKILRVLQEKRFFPVGAESEMRVDIRIVAATNRNLRLMVKENRFREDLFHRLNTLAIGISPLRERKEDLRLLVERFISLHEPPVGLMTVEDELIHALTHLELTGNVRELRNVITTALAARTGHSSLALKDLPVSVWQQLSATDVADIAREAKSVESVRIEQPPAGVRTLALRLTSQHGWNLSKCLSHCEREIIEAALQQTNNNQSRAARLLGLTPRSVYNKVHKYRIAD